MKKIMLYLGVGILEKESGKMKNQGRSPGMSHVSLLITGLTMLQKILLIIVLPFQLNRDSSKIWRCKEEIEIMFSKSLLIY